MPSKSKAKGNTFERKVIDLLLKYYNLHMKTNLKYGKDIRRTPNSGAVKDSEGWSNDVLILNRNVILNFPFAIECKRGYGWKFDQIFNESYSSIIYKAIDQCLINLEDGVYPLVVLGQNGSKFTYCIYKETDKDNIINFNNKIVFKYGDFDYHLVKFEDFLDEYLKMR